MDTVKFIYNKQEVDFLPTGTENIMVNATQMAKIFGKKVENFTRIEPTKNFIDECLKNANKRFLLIENEEDLIVSKQKSGTWMHRILALKFAAWLDPAFELWIFLTIDKVILGHFKEWREATKQKIRDEKLRDIKREELLIKYPEEFSEYLLLEGRISEAQKKRVRAIKATANQLKLDLPESYQD